MPLDCSLTATVAEDRVRFTYAVTNGDSEPVELTFRDAGKADVAVRDGDREVWRWSDGRMFAQVVETVELAPGEAFEVVLEWADPASGSYEAVAELRARDSCEARTTFSV